jgi:hypothetical protein
MLPYFCGLGPDDLPVPISLFVEVGVPIPPAWHSLALDYDFELRLVSNDGRLTVEAYYNRIGLPHEIV